MQYPTADDTPEWMEQIMPGFVKAGHMLWDRGSGFDLISDRQIAGLSVEANQLASLGGRYRVLLLPECDKIPETPLEQIARLVEAGATVVVQNRLPEDVPGLGDLKNRRDKLQAIVENLKSHQHGSSNQAGVVRGRLLIGDDVEQLLADTGVSCEAMVDLGLKFDTAVRDHDDRTYFVVNNSDSKVDQWVPLSVDASKVVLLDPATAQIGLAASRRRSNSTEVYLQLLLRETVVVRASTQGVECPSWKYLDDGKSVALNGNRQVEFVKGGPDLPKTQSIDKLSDWTTWSPDAEALKSFSGLARYRLEFRSPVRPPMLGRSTSATCAIPRFSASTGS